MSGMRIPKRIHIMPLGYEKERIIEPALQYDADRVILVDYEPSSDESETVHRPDYHDEVRTAIRDADIEVVDISCDIFDLYSSLGMIAQLAAAFEQHNVYVNLASGSKVTAIGGMLACMATGAIPYYVKAANYAGGEEDPVAWNVTDIETLPKYHIQPPERQHIAILGFIAQHEPVTKQDIIEFGTRENLPFIARYDTEGVQNPTRGYYRRLDSQIITPMVERSYIDVEEHSKYRYVSITESGANTLQAFRYLWQEEDVLPVETTE
jgi:hypothetical protein